MPASVFTLKIKLRANEQFFRNFRCALGVRRQNVQDAANAAVIIKMQDFCGDIEMSLYSARTKLSSRDFSTNPTGK